MATQLDNFKKQLEKLKKKGVKTRMSKIFEEK